MVVGDMLRTQYEKYRTEIRYYKLNREMGLNNIWTGTKIFYRFVERSKREEKSDHVPFCSSGDELVDMKLIGRVFT